MPGEIYAVLTVLCWSIGIFPFTEAAKRLGAAALNQYRLLLAWLIISGILWLYAGTGFGQLFTRPLSGHFLLFGLSGIIGFTIGDYFSFLSFKTLGPKLSSLYFSSAPGAALVAGYFLMGETIGWLGVAGMLVSIGGVVWLTLSANDKRASEEAGFVRSRAGIVYGVAGAVCQGTGLVLSKMAFQLPVAEPLPTLHAVWIRLLFAFAAAFVLSALTGRFWRNTQPVVTNQNGGLPYMVMGVLFGPVCGVTLSLASVQLMPVAAAQTIFALMPMVVLPINYFYYKERITLQAVLACLLAVAGVVLLIYRDTLL